MLIKNNRGKKQNGFTLIELLVVMAILALLAGLVGPQLMKYVGESQTKTARLQIGDLEAALDMYRLDVGRYPDSDEGLEALIKQSGDGKKWNGPYLKKKVIPKDPWDNAYHYRSPGEQGSYDLYSLGQDNAEGGEGDSQDVTSWE